MFDSWFLLNNQSFTQKNIDMGIVRPCETLWYV